MNSIFDCVKNSQFKKITFACSFDLDIGDFSNDMNILYFNTILGAFNFVSNKNIFYFSNKLYSKNISFKIRHILYSVDKNSKNGFSYKLNDLILEDYKLSNQNDNLVYGKLKVLENKINSYYNEGEQKEDVNFRDEVENTQSQLDKFCIDF